MTLWPFHKPNPQQIACERLAVIVENKRNSYEIQRFRERRAAALKGLGK